MQDKSNANGPKKELNYDPQCGISEEEFKWRCSQAEKVQQRMPQALHKLSIESEKVRNAFGDDPDALKKWDEYMDNIHYAFSRDLTSSLSSHTQNTVLYEQLMRRKARSKTFLGMLTGGCHMLNRATKNKVPKASVLGTVAVAFATGVAVGPILRQQQQTKETS